MASLPIAALAWKPKGRLAGPSRSIYPYLCKYWTKWRRWGPRGCSAGGVGLAEDGMESSAELSSQLYRHLTLGWVTASAANEKRRHQHQHPHPRAKHCKDTVHLCPTSRPGAASCSCPTINSWRFPLPSSPSSPLLSTRASSHLVEFPQRSLPVHARNFNFQRRVQLVTMDVKTVPFQAFSDQKAGTYVIQLPLPLDWPPTSPLIFSAVSRPRQMPRPPGFQRPC